MYLCQYDLLTTPKIIIYIYIIITRVSPLSLASDALVSFNEDVRQSFVLSSAIEVSDTAWKQAKLSLRFGA